MSVLPLAYAVMHGLWRSATEKSGCAVISLPPPPPIFSRANHLLIPSISLSTIFISLGIIIKLS